MGTLKPHSNGPLYKNTVIGTLAVDWWAVTLGTERRGLDARGGAAAARPSPPSPLFAVANVIAHPSTKIANVIIIIRCGAIIAFAL